MTQKTQFFGLRGGLNLVTPAIELPAGHCIAALNYEPSERGYSRVGGYERYSGKPKPSEATYAILRFADGVTQVEGGEIVVGGTSAATATAVRHGVLEGGAYANSDAAGYLVLTNISGTFQAGEDFEVEEAVVATYEGSYAERGAADDDSDRAWLQFSIERARSSISAVPGSGNVRGVWVYNENVYAIRDNDGATAGVLYVASASGWTAVNLGATLPYDGGTVAFVEGLVVTGGTSAATGTIRRLVLSSGTWGGSNAAGYLVLSGVSGVFQNNEAITASTGAAVVNGTATAHTLPAGGRYEFVNHNFYGASNLYRMYGVNGVGRGFEFDGTAFIPIIVTGLTDAQDKPTHLAVHRNNLFFSYPGGSLQNSGPGDPHAWTAILGASEIGLGEDVTGMLGGTSGVLAIWGARKVSLLYGADADEFELRELSNDSGAAEWTVQQIDQPIYLDNRGLRSLSAAQEYGDFTRGSMTRMVEPMIRKLLNAGLRSTASMRVRAKDQYRLIWADGSGLTVYLGREQPEILPFKLAHVPTCTCSGEIDGREVLFFGASNGFVYQADSGTSFDGGSVEAYLRLPFNHLGSPTYYKRFHKVSLESDAGPGARFSIQAEFSYGDADQPTGGTFVSPGVTQQGWIFDRTEWGWTWPGVDQGALEDQGVGGFWDESNWDEFYWSSPIEGVVEVPIRGYGKNMSVSVVSDGTYAAAHTIHGLTIHYTPRRLAR
jgi:hypothetical protein